MRLLRRLTWLASLLSLGACAQTLPRTLTVTHATIVDTVSGRLQPDRTVVVHGNRIASVSPSSKASPTQGEVVDAHGRFLIPGLWDMHTHVYFGSTAASGSDLILPLLLVNGVTGVRDMGSALDPVLKARTEIAGHRLPGPRMVVSGPMLDGPKSHYEAAIPITTPEDGRRAVDLLKGRGVDFIKVQSGIPREAYFAIVGQAKKDGIEFEGHVPDSIRASEAVASGQRTFEHLIGIFEASSPDETKYIAMPGDEKKIGAFLATYDPALEAKIIHQLAANHVWQCPTLFWERGQWLVDDVDWSRDPDLAFATHTELTRRWPAMRPRLLKSLDTDTLATRRAFVEHELDIVRKLHAAGVPFLAGTDSPAGVDLIPGASLHHELERFVAAGFTPLQALQTATLNPAKFFGRLNDFGTVAPGRIADLVLLDANPLEKITNTRTIFAVINDGQFHSQEELAAMRTKLKALAASR